MMRILKACALAALILPAAPVDAGQAPTHDQAASPAVPAPDAQQGFTYLADGRRDPFISLLRRGTDPQPGPASRPAGLAGLLVSEVDLRGIVASPGGYVAILQGADGRTYTVRDGEKLLDGGVRAITPNTLVLLQQVSDPLSTEKQREVRKVLRQSEEAQ